MIELIPFQTEHWQNLDEQEATAYCRDLVTPDQVRNLETQPYSYSIQKNGRVLACAGVIEYWPGRAEAWAMMGNSSRKDFLAIHNAAKRFFEVCPIRRIEAIVELGFEEGHRWAKALGFELEAPCMSKYSVDGRDYAMYARVR